ncbi:MAG: ferrous iron transport protein B [Lachnospiraceae bacterium]|nr:ferrous iron transport protein B [Lachnospiraceae bacterium]
MSMKIALAGNPNCGKTTLFNALTGNSQYVGNWPGVTVEKKEGHLKGNKEVVIQDLPGIYSLSPYTLEEVITRSYLVNEKPDAIINIIDGTNIERNLYLTTQLMELNIPMVIAVNMMDLVRKNGDKIDMKKLADALGCPIVELSALKNEGATEVADKAIELAKNHIVEERPHVFNGSVEHALAHIEESIQAKVDAQNLRWYAVKLFERDEKVQADLKLDSATVAHLDEHVKDCEKEMDDDAESIITNQRYAYISGLVSSAVKKAAPKGSLTTSDKIDRIVTNRFLALPIFAVIIYIVYYLSISTVGDMLTGFVNDNIFADGFNFLGNEAWFVPSIPELVSNGLSAIGCADWLQGLIVDGIVAGVGAVLGFVPQMLVLFLLLAILEECGYMARIAFIMDRIFRRFGLSGKSFIPMLIGTGCGVPAVMASRTIENERDRRMTVMTTTFIPCGAKLPIIALIAGAIFNEASWVGPSAYFIGVAAIIVSGIILKKTKVFAGDPAPFVMELPAYHMPTVGAVLRSMWERGWSFIKKAFTIILLSTIVIWFAMSFGTVDGAFRMLEAEELDHSVLAAIGKAIGWIFSPLGWNEFGQGWKFAVAAVTGLIAKENVVGTFGMLFGFAEVAEDGAEIWGQLSAAIGSVAAFSFMVFNLLCAPCFAAMGAIKREMNSAKWFWIAIGYQCGLAYVVSLAIYQIGAAFTGNLHIVGFIAALAVVAGMLYLLFRKDKYATK